jgi:hypothetical protein
MPNREEALHLKLEQTVSVVESRAVASLRLVQPVQPVQPVQKPALPANEGVATFAPDPQDRPDSYELYEHQRDSPVVEGIDETVALTNLQNRDPVET